MTLAEWTRVGGPSDFADQCHEDYCEVNGYIQCPCGLKVFVMGGALPQKCKCGRDYRVIHVLEVKEPDEGTTSPGK